MSTVAVRDMTPEERRERWWSRRPFPFYVHTKNKYGDGTYLIQSREELVALALSALKSRYENNAFGKDEWYFSGTYEEFVQQEIGLSIAEADALLMDKEPVAEELKKLKARYMGLKRQYLEEGDAIATLKVVRRILSGNLEPFYAIQVLLDRNGRQYEGFEINTFDKIENGVL